MDLDKFDQKMQWAKTMLSLSQAKESKDYLTGYIRGLRRAYHGDDFGSEAEHKKWMALDEDRNHLGNGYRDGFAGMGIDHATTESNRAAYCVQMYCNCSMCALVNYGRDCRNNPARKEGE